LDLENKCHSWLLIQNGDRKFARRTNVRIYSSLLLDKSVKGSSNSAFLQKDQLCYLKRAEKLTFSIYFS